MPIRSKPLEALTEDDIKALKDRESYESRTLEFKEELNLDDGDGQFEFLKDVIAMANESGGTIVYGVKEGDGDHVLGALTAYRPLVEAAAHLHREGYVHRDIKPDNVFVADDGRLVLGDFGIVFFDDGGRVTETYENVGSRDWMPGWAMSMRIEEVGPSFDVFSLGKLLWAMLSGRSRLRLWYKHDEEFELEKMFPHVPEIRFVREILDMSVVEREQDCLKDAAGLLKHTRRSRTGSSRATC